MNESSSDISALTQAKVEKPASAPGNALKDRLLQFWWVPFSFVLPALVTFSTFAVRDSDQNLFRAERVGLIGLCCALAIWGLWRLDVNLGARQRLNESELTVRILVQASGLVLWAVWLTVGVVIAMAYDQVYDVPALLPSLPGN
ncbi:MAG TPA: hypothetical protein PKN86_16170 [Candidatus Obscuribacter sp.]|nr:hypothetical protein [Candidatus Obscuribacter sp.]HMY03907.1 hypothetical protein [Candidatus Obscuribacter sp.]HMY52855.1 hypothetical protein [Candidatus Obscuribacter sp.]HNB17920.1 hypothetical protein [Candidatus Obscuribacter sp.]HND08087.1 hypothetical protein [Candidatus Obscuribacter sp.]